MKKTRPTCWHKTCSRLNSSLGILKTVINDWQQYLIILRTSEVWFGQGHVRAEDLDFDSVIPCFPGEPGSDDPLASEATSSQLTQKSGPMQCPSEFPQGHCPFPKWTLSKKIRTAMRLEVPELYPRKNSGPVQGAGLAHWTHLPSGY